jgi:serine/threonine-protein kinase
MSAASAQVGDIISNRYRLVEEIGRGGFGVVYRAVQLGMERDVAIKMLHPGGNEAMQEQMRDRFRREAMMARNLNHPHTIRQYDFGETADGTMYLVLEYLNGRNLVEVIRQDGPLGDARVRAMAPGILKALSEAHAQGIVHRDLKPANIMLCDIYGEKDFVKILDFGIAKTMMGDTDLTAAGVALGSPRYMPPELLRGDHPVPSSDLYSISITLGEAIIGKPILPSENSVEAAQAQLSPLPLKVPEELTRSSLWPWLKRGLEKELSARYQSADEMLQALESVPAAPLAPLPPVSKPMIPALSLPRPNLTPPSPISTPSVPTIPPVTTSPSIVVNAEAADSYDEAEDDDYAPTMRIDAQQAIAALTAGKDLKSLHIGDPEEEAGEGATQMLEAVAIPSFEQPPVPSATFEARPSPSVHVDESEAEDDGGATQMFDMGDVSIPGLPVMPELGGDAPTETHEAIRMPMSTPTLDPVGGFQSPFASPGVGLGVGPQTGSGGYPTQPTPSQGFPQPTPSQGFPQPTPSQGFPQPTPSQQFPQPTPSQQFPQPTPSQQFPQTGQVAGPGVMGADPARTEFIEFDIKQVTAEQKQARNKWIGVLIGVVAVAVICVIGVAVVLFYLSSQSDEPVVIAPPPEVPVIAEPEVIAAPTELDFRVYSVPEGAELFIEGKASGQSTPARLKLAAADLPVAGELVLDGFEKVAFELKPDGETSLNFRLVELPEKEPEPVVVEKKPPVEKSTTTKPVEKKTTKKPKPKEERKPAIIPIFD